MPADQHDRRSPYMFFVLVTLLTVPFWVISPLIERSLPEPPINLPLSALMVIVPMLVAIFLTWRDNGRASAGRLLGRAFDYSKIRPIWWLPILLLMPLVMALHYFISQQIGGIPQPQMTFLTAATLFLFFFIGAIPEEVGWQGYVYDPLAQRTTALGSAVLIGLYWAAWHIIPLIQADHDAQWIIWQCVFTVLLRVLIVWVYVNNGRSTLAAILLHTMSNLAVFLFPIYSSHYNPMIASIIMAGIVLVVVLLWGADTLVGQRRK